MAAAEAVVKTFFGRQRVFKVDELDDLVQEVLLKWWQARRRYQPGRGASRATYFKRVAENRLRDLLEGERVQKRGKGARPESLDRPLADEEDAPHLLDLIPNETPEGNVERFAELRELRLGLNDLERALANSDRELLQLLARGYRMAEASRHLQVPPATLYGRLKRIRRIARDQGLEEFLQ